MDRMLRAEIVGTVNAAMRDVMERYQERYVTAQELSRTFSFFSAEWISTYGHLLPRERVNVQGHTTRWGYPINKIHNMIAAGAFREIQYEPKNKEK